MKSRGFELSRLSLVQRAALSHVEGVVRREEVGARARVSGLLTRAACAPDRYRKAMECVRAHARVVVHFHPDRFGFRGTTVAEALLKEGVYRNQFETGLSSGSMSAFPGGERDRWENTLFGGVYHAQAVTGSERPKCGALELVRYADGPIPRFGSIGTAAASLHAQQDAWLDWGRPEEALQHLKQLWHVLVHYGVPASNAK